MIIGTEFILKVLVTFLILYGLGHGLGVLFDRLDAPLWAEPLLMVTEWILTAHDYLADFIAARINQNEQ